MIGPGFRLGEATAPERTARDRLTFDAWGDRLTRAQYLDRERTLRQTTHGRIGMHSWVLRLPNLVVAASCETFRLPLAPGGVVEVVASVYVDPPLRGVRMASRLMEALVESRREAGVDGLVLFSEVGHAIYAHHGFKVLPAPTRGAPARPAPPGTPPALGRAALPMLLERRNALRTGQIGLQLLDTLVDWHLARAAFYARALARPEPESVGMIDGEVVARWVADYKNDVLRVLPGASLTGILARAGAEAASLGLAGVELWDDAHSVLLAGPLPIDRGDDVPMGLSFTPRGELFLGPLSRACWA
jgi:GNAT superfamily N-acetyltransferase